MDDRTERRRFLRCGLAATAVSLSGCAGFLSKNDGDRIKDADGDGVIDSEDYAPRDPNVQRRSDVETPETTTTADPGGTGESSFNDDFDYPSYELDDYGWTAVRGGEELVTQSSYLTIRERVDGGVIVTHPQPSATGTFRFEGVKNREMFYGLRIGFVSDGDSYNSTAYSLVFQQSRDRSSNGDRNNILLTKVGAETSTPLVTLVDNHDGEPYDIEIERPSVDSGFTITVNGEQKGPIEDGSLTSSTRFYIKFDGPEQYVDSIEVR